MADGTIESNVRVQVNQFRSKSLANRPPSRMPLEFHRKLPGYSPTELISAPEIAQAVGVQRVWVKNEAERLGLPAFKVLGASWATYRALIEHLGIAQSTRPDLAELRELAAPARPLKLAAATDGNHGRAVARMARWLGLDAEIFVPVDMVMARRDAIASEGATVTVVDGSYDEAVAQAAAAGGSTCLVIADTAWPGYEDVPGWVIDGYSTILWETSEKLDRLEEAAPDVVVMQIGVGAFAASVTSHFRQPGLDSPPYLIGVEPDDADCVGRSIEAGKPVTVPGPHQSIMAGLNCGTPSPVAWPILKDGIDLFLAVGDSWAREAMRMLSNSGIVAGESGGAGLAGLLALLAEGEHESQVVKPSSRILLFNTEGATDPDAYAQIVGTRPA